MVESVFQTLLLLAYFDIALISIAIANFAVSASFLGRESRLSRTRMEKRKERLLGKLKELRETNQIASIKKEIREADKEQNRLSNNIFTLSWLGAVVIPSILFVWSFICAVVGMNSEAFWGSQNQEFGVGFLVCSTILIGGGFIDLLIVIRAIDSAAKKVPIPEIRVYFANHVRELKLKRKETVVVTVCVSNIGEDFAEDVQIFMMFPDTFKIGNGEYNLMQADFNKYPNCTQVEFRRDLIHIEVTYWKVIYVTAPDRKCTHEIPIIINERKTGETKHKLTIEVID